VLVSSISACLSQIKAGKARPLALFGKERSPALPDVPTMKEAGYDIEYYLWVGLFAPKGTPANVITYLRELLNKAAHGEQFKAALANLGQELAYMDQPEFAAFWDADSKPIEAATRSNGKDKGQSSPITLGMRSAHSRRLLHSYCTHCQDALGKRVARSEGGERRDP